MQTTPASNRTHIGIFGKTNAGKSSLLNALSNQSVALVSDQRGTTTDPVRLSMELIPYGPVVLIDTAGLDDDTMLGKLRIQKTQQLYPQINCAVIVHSAEDIDPELEHQLLRTFKQYAIPALVVINKTDILTDTEFDALRASYPQAHLVSIYDPESIQTFKNNLIARLQETPEEKSLLGDLLPYGSHVLLVVPIDSEAPRGRLILPQVQILRDALDHGICCHMVRDTELSAVLPTLPRIDLVITDSQAFHEVDALLPKHLPLTSFSILFARQKGDLKTFVNGARAIKNLPKNGRILIAESCSHNTSHEDIGRVKLPRLLKKLISEEIQIDFVQGKDFPSDLSRYALIVHCGGCMMTVRQMHARLEAAAAQHIPIINYGVLLATGSHILEKSLKPFASEL